MQTKSITPIEYTPPAADGFHNGSRWIADEMLDTLLKLLGGAELDQALAEAKARYYGRADFTDYFIPDEAAA